MIASRALGPAVRFRRAIVKMARAQSANHQRRNLASPFRGVPE
jgi:hypothetical protein